MAKKKDKSKDKTKGKTKAADTVKTETGSEASTPGETLKEREYQRVLKGLHVELVKLQEWVKAKGLKVCIIFEGRDGAGKGGTIKAITERVSPRVFRVVALPAPTEREKTQWYFQRYVAHLPACCEIVTLSLSVCHNRAGVFSHVCLSLSQRFAPPISKPLRLRRLSARKAE